MSGRTFIFAGGGTGGHIFPGLAIAQALEQRDAKCRCVFVCSERAIDAAILREQDRTFVAIPAQPFGLRPRTLYRLGRHWGACVRASRRLIQEERRADRDVCVVAMGGFVAPSAVQAARIEKAQVILVNLDAAPGRANRWISKHADHVLTTYDMADQSTWKKIGPIVRPSAIATHDAVTGREKVGLAKDTPTLVVVGGSLGARTLNDVMERLVTTQPKLFAGWQVLHQTGEADRDRLAKAYEQASVPARVVSFWPSMGEVWGAADLVIARAGAGTVGEIQANAVPAIFLPYPFHKDQHQRLNAEPIAKAEGALIVRDSANAEITTQALTPVLQRLLSDNAAREQMRSALQSLGGPAGADDVADHLFSET